MPPSVGDLWRRLRARDPNGFATRRAIRAAVVVPANFAIGSQVIGDAQVATFAAFGSFALLIFVMFPGGWRSRLGAYLVLAGTGAVLIILGSLVTTPDWLSMLSIVSIILVTPASPRTGSASRWTLFLYSASVIGWAIEPFG